MRFKSILWALFMLLLIGGWLGSGYIDRAIVQAYFPQQIQKPVLDILDDHKKHAKAPKKSNPELASVRVRQYGIEPRSAQLIVRGRTQVSSRVDLKAQTRGLVQSLPFAKGSRVKKGDVVCEIETGARKAKLLQAKAGLEQAELDFEASQKLQTKGFAAETRVKALKAALDSAHAQMMDAELDLKRTQLKAPFDGTIENRQAELGSYLDVGSPCITIVANHQLKVIGEVSEREVPFLKVGQLGKATLIGGQTVEGEISFISPSANEQTRTFRVEMKIPNKDYALHAGVTAELSLSLPSQPTHKFSPTVLTLNDQGKLGVRTLNENNIVQFKPVEVLAMQSDTVWVSAIAETLNVIVVGQEFVSDGVKILPVFENDSSDTQPEDATSKNNLTDSGTNTAATIQNTGAIQ